MKNRPAAFHPGRRRGIQIPMSGPFVQLIGPNQNLQIGGVKLLGFDASNAHKLLFTAIVVAVLYVIGNGLGAIADRIAAKRQKVAFWTGQGIRLVLFVVAVVGLLSIWFDNPSRLATGAGLIGAGLAFAMQKVVTSFAGYFVILRGKTFNIGDRITMGGVRGDVVSLNFIQTVIMEMGEPPAVQEDDPAMWVHSRQYTGRIVTISNAEIFEKPVYNFTREFPYIWEEMHFPIPFKDDRNRAEQIILESVCRHTEDIANLAQPELDRLKREFFIEGADIRPRVYLRITDNWVELSARFLCGTHDIRGLKDRISRDILAGLEAAGIGIASSTYEIVGVPPIRVEQLSPPPAMPRRV
jgi:small-conductance mechanosensitive channel